MTSNVRILDCTLRDGAYIVDAKFGEPAIKGIINKLQNAGIEIIECGWLKDSEHVNGTSFYHVPSDLNLYLNEKRKDVIYTVMIDWDRYSLDNLPVNDGKSIDAIRVVFPHGKHMEGIEVGKCIKEKGYKVYLQAANTLAYSIEDLKSLAQCVNELKPEGLSVVDTFGAMYQEDLERILEILDERLNEEIQLGFHSHNNQQMAFANSIFFVRLLSETKRKIIIDSSLCGMGRGAGNATTELMVNYLNTKYDHNYDLDAIMDAIDIYMSGFEEKYNWGYSTPYYIAGMYCCHVNNIKYLQDNHRTNAKDMRNIIDSLSPDDRKKYNYSLLEEKYIENQGRKIDDSEAVALLRERFDINNDNPKKILLIAPGKSVLLQQRRIKEFIDKEKPITIAVNAILPEYETDYLFITNSARYDYARITYSNQFDRINKILLSNIKREGEEKEYIVNFNRAIKRGWKYFDNAVICALRLMDRLGAKEIYVAGFDGFKEQYNESYADPFLPALNISNNWSDINNEIKSMFEECCRMYRDMSITFLTDSYFCNNKYYN